MKLTKEELLKKIVELEKDNKDWIGSDETVRKNISQFLEFYKIEYYDKTKEVKILRWSEIYFELGKLKAQKDFRDYESNISELECKLEDLEKKIRIEIHPNL